MGALAISLVVIVIVIFLALIVLALGRRSPLKSQEVVTTTHPSAPDYIPRSQHTEYYRPGETSEKPETTPSAIAGHKPKKEHLPRCPLCNAAVGFDDERCPKCKHVLRGA